VDKDTHCVKQTCDEEGGMMKRKKAKRGMRQKLYSGGVVNERPHISIDDVLPVVEREGRRRVARLVDRADPYNLLGR
jgi:hypothetical protein